VVPTEDIDITGGVAAVKLNGSSEAQMSGGIMEVRVGKAEGRSSLVFPQDLPDEWRIRLPELVEEVETLRRDVEILLPAIRDRLHVARALRVNDMPDEQEVEDAAALLAHATAKATQQLNNATPDAAELAFVWRALKVAGRVFKVCLLALAAMGAWSFSQAAAPVLERFGEKVADKFDGHLEQAAQGIFDFICMLGGTC
jgi:hypothetical protein